MDFAARLLFVSVVLLAGPSAAGTMAGPVEARVVRVIDGDTFVADALVWPGHTVRVSVRIRGIDAPEMRSRCAGEKHAARRARDGLSRLVGNSSVMIFNIGGDKYHGRVLADVENAAGIKIGPAMLEHALVRSYDGHRRTPRC